VDSEKEKNEERGKLNKTGPDADGFSFFPIHGSSFLLPRYIDSEIAGSGRGKEPSEGNVLRLIQIRLATPSFEKIAPFVKPIRKPGSLIRVRETQSAARNFRE